MKRTGKILATGLAVGGAVGAIVAANRFVESMAGELNTTLQGEEHRYPWRYGDMLYTVNGSRDSKPLLLIHDFYPGASSYEWRKNVNVLAEHFCVYAFDLLGFGRSDRPSVDYTSAVYTDLVGDFIKEIIGKPTIVVAHGLSCAYAIVDAQRRPQLFDRLVLMAPPLKILLETSPGPINAVCKSALRTPVLGQYIYNLWVSRRAIRNYYDRQGYHNPGLITDELVEYIYTSAHQPYSRFAIASLLCNYLTINVCEPLAQLKIPVVALWGRESQLMPLETSNTFKRVNPHIDVRILDKSSQQLQDEQSASFNALLREFTREPAKK